MNILIAFGILVEVRGDKNRKTHNFHESHFAATTFWFTFHFKLNLVSFLLFSSRGIWTRIRRCIVAMERNLNSFTKLTICASLSSCCGRLRYVQLQIDLFFQLCKGTQATKWRLLCIEIFYLKRIRVLLLQSIRFGFQSWVKNEENGTLFALPFTSTFT